MIQQLEFNYSPPGLVFDKQIKTIKEQRKN